MRSDSFFLDVHVSVFPYIILPPSMPRYSSLFSLPAHFVSFIISFNCLPIHLPFFSSNSCFLCHHLTGITSIPCLTYLTMPCPHHSFIFCPPPWILYINMTVFETVQTITAIYPNFTLLDAAATSISRSVNRTHTHTHTSTPYMYIHLHIHMCRYATPYLHPPNLPIHAEYFTMITAEH